jgi:KaiC/GvpD/RAD55 family RecA-like ATPase
MNEAEHSVAHENASQLTNWAKTLMMTDEEADQISNPEWAYKNLIIKGHLIAIPAEPNGGKTTIFLYISAELVKHGYEVLYINADVSGTDAKLMHEQAKETGVSLLVPDFKSSSMQTIVNDLKKFNSDEVDFNKVVFIFDTLKKMTDVIQKKQAKELYALLRSMTAKGATIILLAHTNKYKNTDGTPIFEGTGDLRSDVDELIYLIPEKHADGSMTVSTSPDKVRGAFEPISFEISANRMVKQLGEYVDTAQLNKAKEYLEKDASVIEVITEALLDGKPTQSDILKHCKVYGIGRRSCESVLRRYCQEPNMLWHRERAFQKNAWNYELVNKQPSP